MPYISKNAPKYKLNSNKKTIFILILFLLAFLLAIYFQFERERKIKNAKQTTAIVDWVSQTNRGGAKLHFYLRNEKINTNVWGGDFSFLKKGDTILIKYSVEDPELIELVDKYYMKKYHYLR